MIVHPLKMCTDDAGPEQSLVMLHLELWLLVHTVELQWLKQAWDHEK